MRRNPKRCRCLGLHKGVQIKHKKSVACIGTQGNAKGCVETKESGWNKHHDIMRRAQSAADLNVGDALLAIRSAACTFDLLDSIL